MRLGPSWEGASCAASQELPNISRKPKVHYRVHKTPAESHTTQTYNSNIHFNIINPPTSTTTRRYIPEYGIIRNYRWENLKSRMY
jgi:hypothetical protein